MSPATDDVQHVHRRRAVGFLLLSALLPGSVQRFAGNRRVGTIALRTWGIALAVVLVVALAAWLAPGPTVGFLVTPWVTVVAKALVWVLFLGWAVVLFDAWRLARPLGLPQRTRLVMTATVGVLVVALGMAANTVASGFTAAGNIGQVLPGGGDTTKKAGRYNVLLLGVDSAAHREGLRPDSITVASVDAETGRAVLFGLPRNMQGVPFPESSPMHELYPDGFRCPDDECMLNAVWTAGEDAADRFPDDAQPGLEATKAAVSETLGLDLNYYAMVDMQGFRSLVDAMGGIELDVMQRIPIGGGGAPVSGYIEPGRGVHLDGAHALWFARSRHDSSDYERMQRQKCVMSAMVHQLDPKTVATRFVELSEAGKSLLRTDVPGNQLVDLASLALKTREHQIAAVNFTPPLVPNTADPDFDKIRRTVEESIARAEAADEAQPPSESSGSAASGGASASSPATPPSTPASPTASPSASKGEAGAYGREHQRTDDLGVVCSAG
ncbi:LCP family protein [uncultured Tessaracoccus sp.]|uniref:LCP family protein n=1 Tax=uncultured Tessaracoccus sp. TaxID=905023 RepID=UPI0025E0968E|nr:LCP family protein [uncultured Tessaracoccus sp.]